MKNRKIVIVPNEPDNNGEIIYAEYGSNGMQRSTSHIRLKYHGIDHINFRFALGNKKYKPQVSLDDSTIYTVNTDLYDKLLGNDPADNLRNILDENFGSILAGRDLTNQVGILADNIRYDMFELALAVPRQQPRLIYFGENTQDFCLSDQAAGTIAYAPQGVKIGNKEHFENLPYFATAAILDQGRMTNITALNHYWDLSGSIMEGNFVEKAREITDFWRQTHIPQQFKVESDGAAIIYVPRER